MVMDLKVPSLSKRSHYCLIRAHTGLQVLKAMTSLCRCSYCLPKSYTLGVDMLILESNVNFLLSPLHILRNPLTH